MQRRHSFGSVCGGCGAFVPDGSARCLICAAERDSIPFEGGFPLPAGPDPADPQPYRERPRPGRRAPETLRRWTAWLSALIVVLLVCITGFGVWRRYFDTGSYRAYDAVLYETEAGGLMISHPGLENPMEVTGVSLQGVGFAAGEARSSPDGRRIAYTSATGELYLLDLAQPAASGAFHQEAVLLAEGLAAPAVFSGDSMHLVYLTRGGVLYASDFAGSRELDTGVGELLAVDGNKVAYGRAEKNAGASRTDLYIGNLAREGGDWTLIDRDIVEVLDWTAGFGRVLYTGRRSADGSGGGVSLLSYETRQNTVTTIAAGIDRVVDASAEQNTAVYLVENRRLWSYDQFIDDDMAAADAALTRPRLDDYPALAAAVALYGEGADFTDLQENEELIEQQNAFDTQIGLWEEKVRRDDIRRRLHNSFANQSGDIGLTYDLYVARGGVPALLDTGVWNTGALSREQGGADAGKGFILYERAEAGSLTRLRMSSFWKEPGAAELDLARYYFDNVRQELMFSNLNDAPSRLFVGGDGLIHKLWRAVPESDAIYFTVGAPGSPGRSDVLYVASLRSPAAGASRVAEDVGALYGAYRGGMLFGADEPGGGALYWALGAEARRLSGADYRLGSLEDGGAALLYYEGGSGREPGALYLAARDTVLLAEKAVGYHYRTDQLVYIQTGESPQSPRDLYVWRGGRLLLLGKGIRGALCAPPPGGETLF